MTVEEFVRARLDEDEQIAEAAVAGPARLEKTWQSVMWDDHGTYLTTVTDTNEVYLAPEIGRASDHIAGNDPDAVLRDIAGKRKILAECDAMDNRDAWWLSHHTCEIVAALAARWANHPDYQPGWA